MTRRPSLAFFISAALAGAAATVVTLIAPYVAAVILVVAP